jgi:hypothetical protein
MNPILAAGGPSLARRVSVLPHWRMCESIDYYVVFGGKTTLTSIVNNT